MHDCPYKPNHYNFFYLCFYKMLVVVIVFVFFFISITTVSNHYSHILSLYDACSFIFFLFLYLFLPPEWQLKAKKPPPLTHWGCYLHPPFSPWVHVASGPNKCILDSLPTVLCSYTPLSHEKKKKTPIIPAHTHTPSSKLWSAAHEVSFAWENRRCQLQYHNVTKLYGSN